MVTQTVLALPLAALIALFAVFVFGGLVKGVTGVGLPLVLVPLATQFVPVPVAVAPVSVSKEVTNVVRSREGGLGMPCGRWLRARIRPNRSRSWCCWCWRPAGSTREEGAILIVYWEGA